MPKIKGKGNETGIESVQSDQKTSDLIEKEIRHFLRSSKKTRDLFQDTRLRNRIEKESQGHLQGD